MPRPSVSIDSFGAIAEPKRRRLLGLLAGGEMPVNGLVNGLGWPQPQVSKHLKVLLAVGLIDVRRDGRQRLYRVNGQNLKPVHEWVTLFERFWDHQINRIKARAEASAAARKSDTQA